MNLIDLINTRRPFKYSDVTGDELHKAIALKNAIKYGSLYQWGGAYHSFPETNVSYANTLRTK